MKNYTEILNRHSKESSGATFEKSLYFASEGTLSRLAIEEIVTRAMEEVEKKSIEEKFNEIFDLRPLLLSHKDIEMVKTSCLHYLGDEAQRLSNRPQVSEQEICDIIEKGCGLNNGNFTRLYVEGWYSVAKEIHQRLTRDVAKEICQKVYPTAPNNKEEQPKEGNRT